MRATIGSSPMSRRAVAFHGVVFRLTASGAENNIGLGFGSGPVYQNDWHYRGVGGSFARIPSKYIVSSIAVGLFSSFSPHSSCHTLFSDSSRSLFRQSLIFGKARSNTALHSFYWPPLFYTTNLSLNHHEVLRLQPYGCCSGRKCRS